MAEDSLWRLVIQDMEKRESFGYVRYGRYLTRASPEVGLREAYEEALDLCVYLRKAIADMDSRDTGQCGEERKPESKQGEESAEKKELDS